MPGAEHGVFEGGHVAGAPITPALRSPATGSPALRGRARGAPCRRGTRRCIGSRPPRRRGAPARALRPRSRPRALFPSAWIATTILPSRRSTPRCLERLPHDPPDGLGREMTPQPGFPRDERHMEAAKGQGAGDLGADQAAPDDDSAIGTCAPIGAARSRPRSCGAYGRPAGRSPAPGASAVAIRSRPGTSRTRSSPRSAARPIALSDRAARSAPGFEARYLARGANREEGRAPSPERDRRTSGIPWRGGSGW